MYGFANKVLGAHWIVSAVLMTAVLMLAEHRPEIYGRWSWLIMIGGLAAGFLGSRWARRSGTDGIVTAATVIVANTFGLALVVAALTTDRGGREADYQALIEVFVLGFGYLLVALGRAARGADAADEHATV